MKNRKIALSRRKQRTRVNTLSWILLALVLLVAYQVFLYMDITNTIDNANILLRSVWHGKILDFYELSVQQAKTNYAANYNFIIYIIFAVWQAPVYLLMHLLKKEYLDCVMAMLWSKGLVIFFFAVTVYWIKKIVEFCTGSHEKGMLAVFLYSSSMAVFYPVFICSQLDVISMSFMLAGIYYYLKNQSKKFWLCFFIAVPCKMFAILLALPLILFRQKNIWKAALLWVSTMGLLLFEKLLFRNSPVYQYALAAQSRDAIQNLLGSNIWLGRSITIFLVCYLGLVLYAYLCKKVTTETILYTGFALWGSFVAFTSINTYWVFLLAPFTILCICCNSRFLKADILVETIGYFCYFVGIVCSGTYVLKDDKLVHRLILAKWIPAAEHLKYGNLVNFFTSHDWNQYAALFSSIFAASVLALLVLTFPGIQKKECAEEKPDLEILLLRPILLGLAGIFIIYAHTAKWNTSMFDTRAQENIVSEIDLISGNAENLITQNFVATDTRELEELTLKFKNTLDGRVNMAMLSVKLIDSENGQCIYQNQIGCSSISDDVDLKIDLKKAKVIAGKKYQLQLTGMRGVTWYTDLAHLYPYFTTETTDVLETASINGLPSAQQLYMELR